MSGVFVTEHGDESVLQLRALPFDPSTCEVPRDSAVVKVTFAGLNFIDIYYRTGLYKKPQLPYVTCDEGCGVIERLPVSEEGAESTTHGFKVGDRVAFFRGSSGAAATHAIVKLVDLFPVPAAMCDKDAASVLLQGATAHYLTHSCFVVKAGDWVLIHAAAGGTGLILSQICHLRGANTIGVCGGAAKARLAAEVGKCTHVVDYHAIPDWEAEVKRLTDGKGVHVVFDGVGKSTFLGSLRSLRVRGTMVSFGNASGPVDPISPLLLTQHGSITLQRPSLAYYASTGGEIEGRVADLFGWIAEKKLVLVNGDTFPLADAAKAFQCLEHRQSIGKVLLKCS